jgi:hypothetical protein
MQDAGLYTHQRTLDIRFVDDELAGPGGMSLSARCVPAYPSARTHSPHPPPWPDTVSHDYLLIVHPYTSPSSSEARYRVRHCGLSLRSQRGVQCCPMTKQPVTVLVADPCRRRCTRRARYAGHPST